MQPAQPCVRFNELLFKSIDETITSLLSRQVADALYFHLEQVDSVSKLEIPNRLDVLSSTLEQTFGRPSSIIISKAIAKTLYKALGLNFSESPHGTLIDYIDEAKMKVHDRGLHL